MNPLRKLDGEASPGRWRVLPRAADDPRPAVIMGPDYQVAEINVDRDAAPLVTLRNALPEIAELYEAAEKVAEAWGPAGRTKAVTEHLVPALAALKEKLR